jgi:uncharacterized protein YjbI with pentapeptide repeats
MVSFTPDERRAFGLAVLTAAATTAVTAAIHWLFNEAQRVVQARRDRRAAHPPVNADGAGADGANADGANADGANADGANADGANADGANADGANADGANADGANADGEVRS